MSISPERMQWLLQLAEDIHEERNIVGGGENDYNLNDEEYLAVTAFQKGFEKASK
jgi:hypothetical protein